MALLAPVDAVTDQLPSPWQLVEVNAEPPERAMAGRGEAVVDAS